MLCFPYYYRDVHVIVLNLNVHTCFMIGLNRVQCNLFKKNCFVIDFKRYLFDNHRVVVCLVNSVLKINYKVFLAVALRDQCGLNKKNIINYH